MDLDGQADRPRGGSLKQHLVDVGQVLVVLALSIVFFTGLTYLFGNPLLLIGAPVVTAAYAVLVKGSPLS